MKKILSVILFMFLLGNVFCQIKEIGCNGGTTTLQKIADTVNSNFDYIDTEITDTIPLSGLVYIKSQTDSICNAKIDSSLTDVSTDTTYLYLVIDSLKARVNILEDTVIIHKNQIAELYQLVYAAFDSMNVTHPIVDATSPEIDSAHTANDSTIYLFASELLNEDSIPVADSFYVTENGVRMGVQTVSITNDTIILETDSTIAYNSNLLVDWRGGNKHIQDTAGNYLNVFNDTVIHNNIQVISKAVYFDDFNSYVSGTDLNNQGGWRKRMGLINAYNNSGIKARSYRDLGYSIYYKDSTVTENQYCQVTITNATGSGTTAPSVRISADSSCYFYSCSASGRAVGKMINGVRTVIASYGTSTTSGTLRIEVEGTTIRCYFNGTLDTSLTGGTGIFTDSDLSSGNVGLYGYENTYAYGDDWIGGDL